MLAPRPTREPCREAIVKLSKRVNSSQSGLAFSTLQVSLS
jgi:hypothetical protein